MASKLVNEITCIVVGIYEQNDRTAELTTITGNTSGVDMEQ